MAIRTYRLYALCCRRTPIGKLLLFLWTPVRGVIATLLKSASVPPTIRRVHTFVHVHLHIAHMSLLGCAHVRMCHVFIDACAHLCAYRNASGIHAVHICTQVGRRAHIHVHRHMHRHVHRRMHRQVYNEHLICLCRRQCR